MRKRIGEYLVERGILKPDQVDQIVAFGQSTGQRFGEAGIELGLLTRDHLIKAFGQNYHIDFFHLQPEYFPQVTKSLLAPDLIVSHGVLCLGFKTVPGLFRSRKLLNLGLLDPSRKKSVEAATEVASQSAGVVGVKTYLLLAPQFVSVLEQVYGLGADKILKFPEIDPLLKMYLDN